MLLFLSSKGFITKEITNHFLSYVKEKKEIALITTAAIDYKEKNRNNIALKGKLEHLDFNVTFVDVEYDSLQSIETTEIIVVNGGNPYYLLHHIKKSKADLLLTQKILAGIPFVGISSGILILMKNLDIIDFLTPKLNTIGLKDTSGLRLIDEVVIPHYDRFVKEGKIQKELVDAYQMNCTSNVTRLGERQCLIYHKNKKETIGQLEI